MIKSGSFYDSKGNPYYVFDDVVAAKGERVDFYLDLQDHSFTDTSKSVASYIRSGREMYYGDITLVKLYLDVYNASVSINNEMKQETFIDEKGIHVIQRKENPKLGVGMSVSMLNGIMEREEHYSPNGRIVYSFFSETFSNTFFNPINYNNYKPVSILVDRDVTVTVGSVDYYSLDTLRAKFPGIDHIEDLDYRIVRSLDEGWELLNKWRNAKTLLKSFDIESTGLGVSIFGEDRITGVVLCYDWEVLGEVESSFYFPFRQLNFPYNLPIEFLGEIAKAILEQPRGTIQDYLDKNNEKVLLLAHNGKMEYKSFWCDGLDVRVDIDTYVLSTLIDTRMERGLHQLKNRAMECTNKVWLQLEQVFKEGSDIRFDILPPEIVRYYACPDCPNTIRVFKYLFAKLPPSEYSVFEIECRLQRCKAINEYYGLRLNQEGLVKRLKNVEYCVEHLSTLFKEFHKTSKNINSADVLRDIVYGQLGCEVVVRTKKNKPSTSAMAIENITRHGKVKLADDAKLPSDIVDLYGKPIVEGKDLASNRYPSLVILTAYNKFKKELGALRRLQKKSIRNRVMFGINGTGAASGRQTSDAHQYSDTMKELVISDTPDHTLISCDYSQVELRVLAYVIQDENLISMMKDKHIDIHRAFLSSIYKIPIHMISAVMRSNGKRVNFGVVYGISEYGLARDKYGPEYTKEQLLECSRAITDFYNGIPGVKDLAAYNRDFVFKHGYIETKFGYRRIFPNAFDPDLDKKAKERIFRAANNTPIQGFAAHLMKCAEIRYDEYIKKMGWDKTVEYMGRQFPLVRIMLSIHDEVLISAHNSIPKEEIVKMCKECMEIQIPGAPPFFAVPAFVANWYQGKADEFEMSISMRDDILDAWEKEHKSIVDWNDLTKSIKDYKYNTIHSYMEELVRKYKTVEGVTEHVDHPEYTHLLIATYVSKGYVKEHTHTECIAEAVRLYMSDSTRVVTNDGSNERREEAVMKDAIEYYNNEVEKYIEIGPNGEAIFEEVYEEETEDEDDISDDNDKSRSTFTNTSVGVVYLGNIAVVDVSLVSSVEDLRSIHSEMKCLAKERGYYAVYYMRGASMIDSGLRIDSCTDDIMKIINKYVKEAVNTCQ